MSMPKYKKLEQAIKRNIRKGIWKPGEKIPREEDLCEEFDVSKITVKRARKELISEGILEHLPGRKGAFVKEDSSKTTSRFIGVAIDSIHDRYRSELFHGIEDKLWKNKFHTIFCHTNFDHEKVKEYFESLLEKGIAGVIFSPVKGAGYVEKNMQILNLLADRQVPYVLLDRYIPNFSANVVVSDNEFTSKELTRSLLHKGHTRILVLAGVECSSIEDRKKGYRAALQEAGLEEDARLFVRVDDITLNIDRYPQQEIERIRTLVNKAGDFTACYMMNVRMLRVIPYIFSGIRSQAATPLEIVTFDDTISELCGTTDRVTIVEQPGYQMGWEAARLLIESIENPEKPVVHMALKSKMNEYVLR